MIIKFPLLTFFGYR